MKIKLNNRRSIYTLLGQIVGIYLFIFGLLILFKVIRLGFSNYPKNSLGYRYDSGPAQFGADFLIMLIIMLLKRQKHQGQQRGMDII